TGPWPDPARVLAVPAWDTVVMDTTPEQISARTAAAWTVALAVLGGFTGYAWDGPFLAVTCALSLAGGGAVGTVLSRRRIMTAVQEGQGKAAALGYADAVADMMVLGISVYRAAVFPLSGPDAVDAAERVARRKAAYRLTAAAGVPHQIREAAAAALEAIDDRDGHRTRSTMEDLMQAVRKQRPTL
uniref:hypothetical protein n=1 Tax=Streptomyces shenzhenensis TaxID=943815 RepID=UPI001C68E333